MKIGDKAKVIDKKAILYNKTVELIEISDQAYIFHSKDKKLKLVVHKDAMQRTIEWETSPDKGETNLDKLLGQNGELVEERKKQVLAGALEIVQRYYEEKPNKMEVVAALFGKKLGENFTVSVPQYDVDGEIKDTVPVKGWFDDRGFRSEQIMFADCYIFAELLEGKAVIVDDK